MPSLASSCLDFCSDGDFTAREFSREKGFELLGVGESVRDRDWPMASTVSQATAATAPPAPPPAVAAVPPYRSATAVSSALSSGAAAVPALQRMPSAMMVNSVRLANVADRLTMYFKGTILLEPLEFFHHCFALAKGIDYALSNKSIPTIAHHLPSIIKQVYLRRNDSSLQSAIMVLMISAKNASKNGWFHGVVADELLSMANELCSSFCMESSVSIEASNALDTISKIMPRFYPKMRFSRLISSFEAKPGYDILLADFHIERNLPEEERIMLFVVQTDNLETSSCITSPSQVSFLINGKGVERRTNVSQDSGPQFPTDITKMLKYGTNIIQAVGYFGGNYLIAIAFVGKIASSNAPILKDYVQPIVSSLPSDSEIIEGPSRISLNCPISFKRIKNPVKGHICKHHQCFDYENFMEMNSRKPSWRCPCCNQSASFVDLRIDQNMVKILGEVGEDVGDVVIFADGSWQSVVEQNGSTDQPHNDTHSRKQDGNIDRQSNRSTSTLMESVDLTMEEDVNNDSVNGCVDRNDNFTFETEDRKPFQGIQGFPVPQFLSETQLGSSTTVITQGDVWPRGLPSVSVTNRSLLPVRIDGHADQSLESMLRNIVTVPVITDAVSPTLNRETASSLEVSQPTLSFQHTSQIRQLVENMQLQQSRLGSSIISSEIERPSIPRHVNRSPIAIQALPVQTQTSSSTRRMRTNMLTPISMIPNGSSASYQTIHSEGFNAVSCDMEMLEIPRTSDIPMTQKRDHQDYQQILNPAAQQVVGLAAPNIISPRIQLEQQRVGVYRSPLQASSDHQNSHNLLSNLRTRHTMSQPTIMLQQPSRVPATQAPQASQSAIGTATGNMGNSRNPLFAANFAAEHATRMQAGPVNSQTFRTTLPIPSQRTVDSLRLSGSDHLQTTTGVLPAAARADGLQELPSEQHWRPTGRMRGSLTGSAYSAALNQYLVPSTQPVPARPPASAVASTSDPFSVLVANNLDTHGPVTQQGSLRDDDGDRRPGVSSI